MPILDAHTLDFFSRSPEQTRRIGMRLGKTLRTGDVICLQGDLGAGKTTFVQGVAKGWGTLDTVSSPTFILVNLYRRADGAQLHHMDAYRLESVAEAEQLDLDSMLEQGPLLVEWAERIRSLIPKECIWLELETLAEEHRQLRFRSTGRRPDALLADLRRSLYGGA